MGAQVAATVLTLASTASHRSTTSSHPQSFHTSALCRNASFALEGATQGTAGNPKFKP